MTAPTVCLQCQRRLLGPALFVIFCELTAMTETGTSDLKPQQLANSGDALQITWMDGRVDRIAWRTLRKSCPCATCRTEREKPAPPQQALPSLRVLKPSELVPLKPTRMHPVGNYAYSIHFSDGHNTGIYSLELLRKLGGESTAAPATSPAAGSHTGHHANPQ